MIGVVIGMLAIARLNFRRWPGHSFFGRSGFVERRKPTEPLNPCFNPELLMRWKLFGMIKRTHGQIDPLTFQIIIEKRGSAIRAKPACNLFRTFENRRRPARPYERIARSCNQSRKHIPHCLLAHPAMTDMRVIDHRRSMIAHRAALAPAGDGGLDLVHSGLSTLAQPISVCAKSWPLNSSGISRDFASA